MEGGSINIVSRVLLLESVQRHIYKIGKWGDSESVLLGDHLMVPEEQPDPYESQDDVYSRSFLENKLLCFHSFILRQMHMSV